jgi:hypothetical protein
MLLYLIELAPVAGLAQTRKSVQIITAEEYDAAVRLNPDSSPLAATGDRRTGRELLADAEADAQLSVSAAAATPRGRAVLGRLVSLARAVRDHIRQRAADYAAAAAAAAGGGLGGWWSVGAGPGVWVTAPDPRAAAAAMVGCSGGYRAGRGEAERLAWAAAEAAAAAAVERPLRTRAMVLVERGPVYEPEYLAEIGARRWWAGPIMRRIWTFGHSVRHPPRATCARAEGVGGGHAPRGLPAQALARIGAGRVEERGAALEARRLHSSASRTLGVQAR